VRRNREKTNQRDSMRIIHKRFCFIASRTPQDPEKAILPTIFWISTNHPSFKDLKRKGFMFVFGWWDWSIKIGFYK